MQERTFVLESNLHPEKTRLIEFSELNSDRRTRGLGKPETFDFLGFKHYCAPRDSLNGYTSVFRGPAP